MIILVDDENRENEGDLIVAAEHITPEMINFMAMEARGLICLALHPNQIDRLQLPQMVREDMNLSPNRTAFTVSIEASHGVSTGISAADRAHTIRVASRIDAGPQDISMPGHVFPIRAQQGGVLKRAGHTEASVDIAYLAGLNPAAVICEVMNSDGSMARVPDLKKFSDKHDIKIGTIVDLIQYRLLTESLVHEVSSWALPTDFGKDWDAKVFRSQMDQNEHLVLIKGDPRKDENSLVRIHVDRFARDIFQSWLFEKNYLQQSISLIENAGSGVILILRGQNAQGLGGEINSILDSMKEPSFNQVTMDERDYGIGAQLLRKLGIKKVKMITNHPEKKIGLKAFDVEIIGTVALKKGNP